MKNNKLNISERSGFTFIEILIVIAIIAVLAIGVIFFLNPSQLQSQARDNNRVSDLTTINQDIALYHETQPAGALGSSSVVYVSIPDPTATSTAGTNCAGIGLVSTSTTYHCASPSTYRLTDGTGWIPVNFSAGSNASLLATLPVDPVNTTSSNEYYVYVTNGNQYEVLANPEAAKTIANSTTSFVQGNNLALLPSFPGTASTATSTGGTGGGVITYTTSTYIWTFGPSEVAFDSHTNSIWVSNRGSNSVTKIDDTTFATTSYAVAYGPIGITFDSHTNSIWVASDNIITKIDDATFATTTYNINSNFGDIAFDSHTNSIWVADPAVGTVTKINDATGATTTYNIGSNPGGIAFDSHTNSIWVSTSNSSAITKIDDTTFATTSYAVAGGPSGVAFDSHTNSIWTTSPSTKTVIKIDDTTFATTTTSYAVGVSSFIAFDSHTNSIWVSTSNSYAITKIDDTTFATTSYAVGGAVLGIGFDSHTNSIWVPNQVSPTSSYSGVTVFTPSQ